MRSQSKARRALWLSVALALALLAAPGCGGGSGPTGPPPPATPIPQAPNFSVAGTWSGTIAYGGPPPSSEAVSAEISQAGAQVDATIEASRFSGRFSGTIRGDQLTGQLTTVIENVPFGAAAVGTVSSSAIHLVADNLRFQNLVMSGETTIDLSR
jgi:autotransporter translocation and assembly factor TamB